MNTNGGLSTGQRLDDHEVRIRRIERWVSAAPLTVISSIIAAVAAIIAAAK